MLFYFAIICAASTVAGVSDFFKRRNRYLAACFFVISAIILFIPLANRGLGVDYIIYQITYSEVDKSNWQRYWSHFNGRPEPFYAALNFLAKWIFGSFHGVNWLCALLSIAFTFAGIYRYKQYIHLGLTVFTIGFSYYIMMYGLNRMMIAVSIVTWAYQYYQNKKLIKYIFWITVAGLFHYSAFVMLPLYFVMHKMNDIGRMIRKIGPMKAAIGVGLIFAFIYVVFPRLFGSMSWYQRYAGYFSLTFTPGALNNNLHLYFCVYLVFHFRKTIRQYHDEIKRFYPMMVMLLLTALGSTVMPIHRICFFMFPCASIMYGAMPGIMRRRNPRSTSWNVAVYYCIVFAIGTVWIYYFLVMNGNWNFIVPYIPYTTT